MYCSRHIGGVTKKVRVVYQRNEQSLTFLRHFFHATLARTRQSGFDDYDEDDNLDDGNDDKPSQTKNSLHPNDADGSETEDSDDETAPPPPRPKTVQDWLEPTNKEDDEDEDMDSQRLEAIPEPESDTESEGDAEEPPGSDSDAQTLDESYDIVDIPSVDDVDVTIANDSSPEVCHSSYQPYLSY